MRRNAALAAAALAGAAVGALLARARKPLARVEQDDGDPRAAELRRKLAEARSASAEEDEFEAAGMGAETIVDEPPGRTAGAEILPPEPDKPLEAPAAGDAPERPANEEFEAMRRRIHEEGRAAADEMRRDPPP